MPENELGALVGDIEAHGQREAGILFEGMVLDGWHRYLACAQLGVQFKAKDFDGADPVAFVISKNLHRRHLTESQRAGAVVKCHEWRANGMNAKAISATPAPVQGSTNAEMAREADVSERTIVHAKRAEEVGLGDEVRAGKVSAKAAAKVAKLPKKKREKAVEAIKAGEAPPKPKAVIASRDVEKLYEACKAELADVKERYETLGETARELQDKLEMFETTEPDEQQKKIAELQKLVQRKDGEITRQRGQINDLNNKCNALIRQVKSLQKGRK